MSGAAHRADADSYRAVPGADTDAFQQPGRLGKPVGQAVLVDYLRAYSRRGSGQQPVPVAGFEPARPFAHRDAGSGGRNHLGAAEDDANAVAGPASAVKSNDDVMDDADFSGRLFPGLAQRVAALLGGLQPHRHRHPVFYYRLGPAVPPVPAKQRRRGGCCAGGCPGPAGE